MLVRGLLGIGFLASIVVVELERRLCGVEYVSERYTPLSPLDRPLEGRPSSGFI